MTFYSFGRKVPHGSFLEATMSAAVKWQETSANFYRLSVMGRVPWDVLFYQEAAHTASREVLMRLERII